MLKRLVKQGKHYLPLPEESYKNGRMLSKNRRPETIAENGRFPAKTGGLQSLERVLLQNAEHGIYINLILVFAIMILNAYSPDLGNR